MRTTNDHMHKNLGGQVADCHALAEAGTENLKLDITGAVKARNPGYRIQLPEEPREWYHAVPPQGGSNCRVCSSHSKDELDWGSTSTERLPERERISGSCYHLYDAGIGASEEEMRYPSWGERTNTVDDLVFRVEIPDIGLHGLSLEDASLRIHFWRAVLPELLGRALEFRERRRLYAGAIVGDICPRTTVANIIRSWLVCNTDLGLDSERYDYIWGVVEHVDSVSQLNGSHGEYTNTDDMSNHTEGGSGAFQAQKRREERLRITRDAANTVRVTNRTSNAVLNGSSRGSVNVFSRNRHLEAENAKLQAQLGEHVVREESREDTRVVRRCVIVDNDIEDALFQLPGQFGTDYCTRSNISQMSEYVVGPNVFQLILSRDEIGPCMQSGYGWAIISSDPTENLKVSKIGPATRIVYNPGFRYRDASGVWITIPPNSYRVYEPLWVKLNREYKTARLDQRIVDVSTVNGVLGEGISTPVFAETVKCFHEYVLRRSHALMDDTRTGVLVQNNANFISQADPLVWNPRDSSVVLHDVYMPWQELDAECDLPMDWQVRNDFTITRNVGPAVDGEGVGAGPLAADILESGHVLMRNGCKPKKRYRTRFFGFAGLNLPEFLEYNASANNLNHGLKRLIGAKKDELGFREKAMKLGAHLAVKMHESLDVKNVSVVEIYKELVGKRLFSSKWDAYGDTRAYVDAVLNSESRKKSAKLLYRTFHTDVRRKNNFVKMLRYHVVCDKNGHMDAAKSYYEYLPTECPDYEQREFIASVMHSIWERAKISWLDKCLDTFRNGKHWVQYEFLDRFLPHYAAMFGRDLTAQIQHVKRMLRRRYIQGALFSEDTDVLVNRLDVMIKRELAKFGKAPRLYVTYGAGCVYANEMPEFAKIAIDGKHTFTLNGVTAVINIMAKPRPTSLAEIFTDLSDAMVSRDFIYIAIYSDDMCMAGNIGGRVIAVNLDIESNDSSQDCPAFTAAFSILRHFNSSRAAGLIRQCMKPLIIRNPEDYSSFLEMVFDGPLEGSGSVLTTLLNHLGSALIAASIIYLLAGLKESLLFKSEGELEMQCKQAAAIVGHSVTFDSCMPQMDVDFHHFQFLKRSPFKVGDKWMPYMNLGCILRSLGSVEDNLEPHQIGKTHAEFVALTNEQRIDLFCGAIVNGWKNEPTNPIMTALRERFGSSTTEVKLSDSQLHVFDELHEQALDLSVHDNTHAILCRYGLCLDEVHELASQIRSVHVGQLYRSTAMAKILNIDYGVKYL